MNAITKYLQKNLKGWIIALSIIAIMFIVAAFLPMTNKEEIKDELIKSYKIKDGLMELVIDANKIIIKEQSKEIILLELQITNLNTKLNLCREE